MYIVQAKNENFNLVDEILKLIVGLLITFLLTLIFSIPHAIAILYKLFKEFSLNISDNESFLNSLNSVEAKLNSMNISDQLSILEPNLNLFLMLLSFVGMMLGIVFSNKFIHHNTFNTLTTSRKKIDFSRITYSFLLWGFIVSFMLLMGYILYPDNYEINFKAGPFIVLVLIAIILIPIQSSAEEYLLRGYMMQRIGIITRNRWFPLLFTSVIFGLLHSFNPEITEFGNSVYIFYVSSGLFAGIITLMDEGLELAIGWHVANNFFTALLVTSDWSALQTHSILKDVTNNESLAVSDLLIPIIFLYPILFYIFSKKYGWKNWRIKLLGKI
jgi:hypothetical protein